MTTARAGMKSDPPTVKIEPIEPTERQKYIKCWELADYRKYSPGEGLVDMFLELGLEPDTLIDWGSGTGRAALKLHKAGFDVIPVDFAPNCLDPEVKEVLGDKFVEHDLTEETELTSEIGFCTDVMEHIPTEDVPKVLKNIIKASKQCFFQISTSNDIFSKHPDLHVDGDLHLTVADYGWWLEQFAKLKCIIHRSIETSNSVIFFVTGWSERSLSWKSGHVNTDIEILKQNIETNSKLGIQPIQPYGGDGEVEVMLLCGGPTLNDFEDEIREKREAGVKAITVNGTYNWCIERGIKPSLQCMVDAREFNKRFVEQGPLTEETKYAISAQCDPSIFDIVPHDRTYIWQTSISKEMLPHIEDHFGKPYKDWWPSPGGTTVGLRALMLLRVLGFNKIHVYGMDSCVFPDKDHHAYEQEENDYLDEKDMIGVIVGKGTEWEKTFQCQLWQAFQAAEFQSLVPQIPDDVKLRVYGDGLIAYFLETAAKYGVSLEVEDAAMPPE